MRHHAMHGSAPSVTSEPSCLAGDGELAALMRGTDWSQRPLGSVETWPHSLQVVVRILLTSRYAMWMGWGPELTFFYNDADRPTLGVKHPHALGKSAREVWAEIWPDIGPRAEAVVQNCRTCSIASGRRTPRPRGCTGGSAWGCQSSGS
jgi:hypothetical protein